MVFQVRFFEATTTSDVVARHMWFYILQRFGLQELAPNLEDTNFDEWWVNASGRVSGPSPLWLELRHNSRSLKFMESPQSMCV